ncbi:hypothetical protein JM658_13385 [Joostella atrarenae]|uniref:Peptidase E n=1 Tax=Joostella atrarenae TaxID=679257 RepID=A0ABS9J5Y8_9FLAO|nr:DUF6702 family protein [Joostella atrarenae]MCF8715823.1 hypothetical protein [Joostella atrarenae]
MKKYIVLLLILPLLSFGIYHKFYLSVTDINYAEEDQAIQMISRYFIDDLEKLFKERYGIDAQLKTKEELKNIDSYIEKYLHEKFIVSINGEEVTWNFIGKEYDVDVMKCYLEIPKIKSKKIKSISVESKVLFDVYPEQQNVVHININDHKKSFMLIKQNDKAMLKL